MAGVSTKEIKNRIRSMESTRQITKAMEMVAASKLRRAQNQILASRPYFQILSATIQDILKNNRDFSSPYLKERPVTKVMYIVIAGDRGLAGGYNSNILKMVETELAGKEATVLPVGKKAVEFFRSRRIPAFTEIYADAADVDIGDCFSIAKNLSKAFLAGEFDEVHIAYTNFVSVLSQVPMDKKLLPLQPDQTKADAEGAPRRSDTIYEPGPEEVFAAIVPEYLGGILYGALCESRAAEQAARRSAMDSATQNADEMIADLSLKFNRARQAAITQEITEIVAGS
jgi:F-type H+-transporting ATPase subunit gamma